MTEKTVGEFCVVMTTASSQNEANRLAHLLVEQKLAACVQMSSISSVYVWEEAVRQEPEVLMLIKTSQAHYASIETLIVGDHSYSVPEIIQLPIVRGLPAYLQWLSDEAPVANNGQSQ